MLGLAVLTGVRLAVASTIPLSPDEAYYWVWSRALAPGYPDHPPMVALWIRAGTALLGEGPLGVRLLAPFAAAVGSLLLVDAALCLFPAIGLPAAIWSATALNATLLFAVGAVTMTPDTPLLFFWTVSIWALARFARRPAPVWLLACGLAGGLALDSKYTAALLAPGIAVWLLLVPALRPWLRRGPTWVAALIAAAAFAPVILWNADHGWASFARQGSRAAVWAPDRALRFEAELFFGQIGLVTPLLFALSAGAAWHAVARALRSRDPGWTLIACLTAPGAAIFAQHALGDRVQANWPAILYPACALAAAALPFWRGLRRPAVALGLALGALVYIQAALNPLAASPHLDPTMRQLAGWPVLAEQVETVRSASGATFVVADDYGVAAELARLMPPGTPVVGVDARWRLFDLPHPDLDGRAGVLVRSERRAGPPDASAWSTIDPAGKAIRGRDGIVAEAFSLWRVTGRPGARPDVAMLPRPGQ